MSSIERRPATAGHGLIDVPDNFEDMNDFLYEQGWTDGLPVVPPTPERVARMAAPVPLDPAHVLGIVPPAGGEASVEAIAVNAVMAGCRPAYFPVLLATVGALLDPAYGLAGRQTSTHPGAPLMILNGPVVRRLSFNYGAGCFGPGWRANATLGRAVRLILMNVGGAVPGDLDSATHGHPGKYTYCIAEHEEANPWEPLHVERGYPRGTSTVTVINAEAPHSINDARSRTARGLIGTVASAMSSLGCNNVYYQGEPVLVLGPEHAQLFHREGWSKRDVKAALFEAARQPVRLVRDRGMEIGKEAPHWINWDQDDASVPVVHRPDDLIVVVAGGAGSKSMCAPTAGRQSRSVTRAIHYLPGDDGAESEPRGAQPV